MTRHIPGTPSFRRSPKVLFIAGTSRSGSTVLDQVLGEIDDFCAIGELGSLWSAGLIDGEPCGCGVPVPQCRFWNDALAELRAEYPTLHPPAVARLIDAHIRLRPRALWTMTRASHHRSPESAARAFARMVDRIYAGIARTSGARVIIDSTKAPAHAYALSLFSETSFYVLHLLRDPRATAYSWLRNPDAGARATTGVPFKPPGVAATAEQWNSRSLAIETLLRPRLGQRFMQLRYEDFASAPALALERVLAFLEEDKPFAPVLVEKNVVSLGPNHILASNHAKHRRGRVPIALDAEWQRHMPKCERRIVTLLTLPLLARYGYAGRSAAARNASDASFRHGPNQPGHAQGDTHSNTG